MSLVLDIRIIALKCDCSTQKMQFEKYSKFSLIWSNPNKCCVTSMNFTLGSSNQRTMLLFMLVVNIVTAFDWLRHPNKIPFKCYSSKVQKLVFDRLWHDWNGHRQKWIIVNRLFNSETVYFPSNTDWYESIENCASIPTFSELCCFLYCGLLAESKLKINILWDQDDPWLLINRLILQTRVRWIAVYFWEKNFERQGMCDWPSWSAELTPLWK